MTTYDDDDDYKYNCDYEDDYYDDENYDYEDYKYDYNCDDDDVQRRLRRL